MEKKTEMIAERIRDINAIVHTAVDAAAIKQKLTFDANALLM